MRLTEKKKKAIRTHAGCSLFRANTGTADCYTFSLTTDGEWTGGWDWTFDLIDKYAQWVYIIDTGVFKRLN